MEVIHPRCCRIDVLKESVVVCLRIAAEPTRNHRTTAFPAGTAV